MGCVECVMKRLGYDGTEHSFSVPPLPSVSLHTALKGLSYSCLKCSLQRGDCPSNLKYSVTKWNIKKLKQFDERF
jgi:hypothetical protein